MGRFGKDIQKLSMWMLENKLAHFVSSDAHRTKNRTFILGNTIEVLKQHLDEDYISDLVENNARKILNSEKIEKVKIPELSAEESFFEKLKKKFKFSKKDNLD